MIWCDGLSLEDWEERAELNGDDAYLHGNCEEWVLDHYQHGDIPVIWNHFDESVGKVCLIHCFIKRENKYVDVRGETDDIEDIEEGFDYCYDSDKYYCRDLDDYKCMIRKICGYRSKRWK
jgi:hypothetical protein